MFRTWFEEWKEKIKALAQEGEEVVILTPAERVSNAAKEIYNFRFSLASGAHGLYEIEQAILKHLEG